VEVEEPDDVEPEVEELDDVELVDAALALLDPAVTPIPFTNAHSELQDPHRPQMHSITARSLFTSGVGTFWAQL
jgi:hypothetical protein